MKRCALLGAEGACAATHQIEDKSALSDRFGPMMSALLMRFSLTKALSRCAIRGLFRESGAARSLAKNGLPSVFLNDRFCDIWLSNFFEKDWQHSYWGSNYPRLASVKKKYDPTGLFFVHNGVGSEEWSADGFTKL